MAKATTLHNHIETDVPGDFYRRAKEMRLLNPKDGVKSVEYYQQDFVNLLNNKKTTTEAPMLKMDLTEDLYPTKINLVNPATNDIIGQKTIGEIIQTTFLFAHSLYVYIENKTTETTQTDSTPIDTTPVTITPVEDPVIVEPVIVEKTI